MRKRSRFILFFSCICCTQLLLAQTCVPTGLNGTSINFPCGAACSRLKVQVPHLKSTDDYEVVSTAYNPYAYVTSAPPLILPCANQDDKYFDTTILPFRFCFYGTTYGQLAIGTNGVVSFDSTNALKGNNYALNASTRIPYAGTGNQGAGACPTPNVNPLLPRAAIFGAFYDLYPQTADRVYKIEAREEGVAPCRKFIISYADITLFSCTSLRGTSQIVLHESSGLIDVYIGNKPDCPATNGGLAVLGIQNMARNKAVAAPGKNSTRWTESNAGYRFVPSGITSRFAGADLYNLSGTLLQTTDTDTATTTPGLLDIDFNNVCITGASQQFIVKTYFRSCTGAGTLLTATDTITVIKNILTSTSSSTPVACSGAGSATITLSGSPGPYTYILNNDPPVTDASASHTFTGLTAGTYVIIATSAAGCRVTETVTVTDNGGLQVQSATTPATCVGAANGSITINPQNGVAPFQYSINSGPYVATNVFHNLAAGTYSFTVKDAAGCLLNNYSVTVAAGAPVTASVAVANISCYGNTNGSATATLSANATAPFQYSLDGVTYQASNTFTGLPAGSYTLFYKEAVGCNGTTAFTITEPALLTQNITTQDVRCNGQSNGTITITAGGGTAPYQYSIDGTTYQTANTFTVPAGPYTLYSKDAGGCVKTGAATISQPAVLGAVAQTQNATCTGGADGTITVTATGGTGPYQYSVNGTTYQASNVLNAGTGVYTITVKDANGCTSTTNATVGITNNVMVRVWADTTICEGTPAQLNAVTNANQYSWTPAATLNSAVIINPVATPSDTTKYILTASFGACTATDSMVVNVIKAPIANAGGNNEICFGQSYTLQGSGGAIYQWSPLTYFNGGSVAATQNPSITPTQTITYSLRVTDAVGCNSLRPATATIRVTPPIVVTVTPKDTVVAEGDVFQLQASSVATDYVWSPGFGLDNLTAQNPMATAGTDIQYTVTASTAAGCKGSASVTIRVVRGPEIYVPGGFTPNGDGKNDVLRPFLVSIKELRYFRVYNRWGRLVFQTARGNAGWDGRIGTILQPTGTYVWIVEGITKAGKVISKKGTATLIR